MASIRRAARPRSLASHAVGPHQPGPLNAFIQHGGELAHVNLGVVGNLAHAPSQPRHRQDRDRKDEKRQDRQQPVLIEHDPDQEQHGQQFLDHAGERVGCRPAQQVDVVGKAGDQPPGGVGLEKGDVGAHQVGEHRLLHVGDNLQPHPAHRHLLGIGGKAIDDGQNQHRAGDQQQHLFIAVDEHVVEYRLHQPRIGGGRPGGNDHAQHRERDSAPVTADMIANQPMDQMAGCQLFVGR